MAMSKRIFSGIKPSGSLHLGNYLGAVRNWVVRQGEGENLFCIVDLHALTVPQDPKELRANSHELAAMYIACGINPKESTLTPLASALTPLDVVCAFKNLIYTSK